MDGGGHGRPCLGYAGKEGKIVYLGLGTKVGTGMVSEAYNYLIYKDILSE